MFRCALRATRRPAGHARRYSSIDDFNKKKTPYSYGVDLSKASRHQERPESLDVNALIENDPRLEGVDPATPEYKDLLYTLHQEHMELTRRQQHKYESRERWKAVLLGLLAMGGIVAVHQLVMNWSYVKKWAWHGHTYGAELDVDAIRLLDDPAQNGLKWDNLVSKYTDSLDRPRVVQNLKPLALVPGLYLFGGNSKQKFPLRVPFFDDMVLQDVQLHGDYLVALDAKGKGIYEWRVGLREDPQLTQLPFKAQYSQISLQYLYLLSDRGEVYYKPRAATAPLVGYRYRNFLGLPRQSKVFGKVETAAKISKMQAGDDHLLLLDRLGKVLVASTTQTPRNVGQFGLPQFAPHTGAVPPVNEALELTGLNHELVETAGERTTRPRIFSDIAAGAAHNLAVDIAGNVWSWGSNTHGQCAQDLSYRTDVQAIPQVAVSAAALARTVGQASATVTGVYASRETSYVRAFAGGSDFLLAFGNGIKGQLGGNVYLHVCPKPQVVKSLTGLSEYDETVGAVSAIGIKSVATGGEHTFVELDNAGGHDVLSFGDNEFGQLGNGKLVRSPKPQLMPQLVEPHELRVDASLSTPEQTEARRVNRHQLTKRLRDNNARLQLHSSKVWQQRIAAGDTVSAIYYAPK